MFLLTVLTPFGASPTILENVPVATELKHGSLTVYTGLFSLKCCTIAFLPALIIESKKMWTRLQTVAGILTTVSSNSAQRISR